MCSDIEQDVRPMSFMMAKEISASLFDIEAIGDLIAFLCVFLHACVRVYYLHGHKYVGA